jgi:threonine dehydrogenase-like Zn-dependent dehydrogenase
MQVGEHRKDQYKIGERYIVQADVYYKGANVSYGYALDGGMSQYGVVGKEVLDGDEGSYLIPIEDDTGYVESALVEPWACVVAAYEYANYRDGILDDGAALIYFTGTRVEEEDIEQLFTPGHKPAVVETIADLASADLEELVRGRTGGKGFDDILVFGAPSANDIEKLSGALARHGVMNLALSRPLEGPVTLDIGRIHYEQRLYIGGVVSSPADAANAYFANRRQDLKAGGTVWFIGAGGPMGQMHIQRAVMSAHPPKTIVVTDVSSERLARITDRFGAVASQQGIEIVLLNAQAPDYEASLKQQAPFDDIVCLVPSADLVAQTAPYLGEDGVYNIFAGVNRGVSAPLDLGTMLAKRQRYIGTSGSSIADLRHTLGLVESSKLSTNSSLAAIGGLDAFKNGIAAVKAGEFPGKTVIFPHIEDLPLLSLDELKEKLPNVYAKLQDGKFWTKAAEEELLQEKL